MLLKKSRRARDDSWVTLRKYTCLLVHRTGFLHDLFKQNDYINRVFDMTNLLAITFAIAVTRDLGNWARWQNDSMATFHSPYRPVSGTEAACVMFDREEPDKLVSIKCLVKCRPQQGKYREWGEHVNDENEVKERCSIKRGIERGECGKHLYLLVKKISQCNNENRKLIQIFNDPYGKCPPPTAGTLR